MPWISTPPFLALHAQPVTANEELGGGVTLNCGLWTSSSFAGLAPEGLIDGEEGGAMREEEERMASSSGISLPHLCLPADRRATRMGLSHLLLMLVKQCCSEEEENEHRRKMLSSQKFKEFYYCVSFL